MADTENMRSGVLGAIYDYKNRKIVGAELIIIAVACGVYFASWWVFGGVLIGLILMFSIRILSFLLCIILTLVWGLLAFMIGFSIGGYAPACALGGIGLLLGYFTHSSMRR